MSSKSSTKSVTYAAAAAAKSTSTLALPRGALAPNPRSVVQTRGRTLDAPAQARREVPVEPERIPKRNSHARTTVQSEASPAQASSHRDASVEPERLPKRTGRTRTPAVQSEAPPAQTSSHRDAAVEPERLPKRNGRARTPAVQSEAPQAQASRHREVSVEPEPLSKRNGRARTPAVQSEVPPVKASSHRDTSVEPERLPKRTGRARTPAVQLEAPSAQGSSHRDASVEPERLPKRTGRVRTPAVQSEVSHASRHRDVSVESERLPKRNGRGRTPTAQFEAPPKPKATPKQKVAMKKASKAPSVSPMEEVEEEFVGMDPSLDLADNAAAMELEQMTEEEFSDDDPADTTFRPTSGHEELLPDSPGQANALVVHQMQRNSAPPSPTKRIRSPSPEQRPNKAQKLDDGSRHLHRSASVVPLSDANGDRRRMPHASSIARDPREADPVQPRSSTVEKSRPALPFIDPLSMLDRLQAGRVRSQSKTHAQVPYQDGELTTMHGFRQYPVFKSSKAKLFPPYDDLHPSRTKKSHKSSVSVDPLEDVPSHSDLPKGTRLPYKQPIVYAKETDSEPEDTALRLAKARKERVRAISKPTETFILDEDDDDVVPSSMHPSKKPASHRASIDDGAPRPKLPRTKTLDGTGSTDRKSRPEAKVLKRNQLSYWRQKGITRYNFALSIKRAMWRGLCVTSWFPDSFQRVQLANEAYGEALAIWRQSKGLPVDPSVPELEDDEESQDEDDTAENDTKSVVDGEEATLKKRKKGESPPIRYTTPIREMCINFITEFRGAIKSHAVGLVELSYNLHPRPSEQGDPRTHIKNKVASLLQNWTFTISPDWTDHKGRPCEEIGTHDAIFDLVRRAFYPPSQINNPREMAAVCPLPIPCLAMAIIAMQAALCEWGKYGIRKPVELKVLDFASSYEGLVLSFEKSAAIAPQRWDFFMQRHEEMCKVLVPRQGYRTEGALAFEPLPDSPVRQKPAQPSQGADSD